jgi:hypothetical protein
MTSIAHTKEIIKFSAMMKKDGINIPICLIGNQGVGKTSITEQVSRDLGYNCVVLNVANQTPEDLLGQIDGKGGYHKPKWIVNSSKPTIYFLDELNRGQKYVLQCMFNFINEGRIHQHHVKPDDIVISAINPDNDDFEVTCFDDNAMWSRFAMIKVQPTKEEYQKYLDGSLKSKYIQMALNLSTSLYTGDNPIDHTYEPKPDNRNMEKVGHILDRAEIKDIDGSIGELIIGMIGIDAASIIFEVFRKNREKPDVKKILTSKKWVTTDKIDEINTFNISLIEFIEKEPVDDKVFDGLVAWVNVIPRDQAVKLLKQILAASNDMFDRVIATDFEKFTEMVEI